MWGGIKLRVGRILIGERRNAAVCLRDGVDEFYELASVFAPAPRCPPMQTVACLRIPSVTASSANLYSLAWTARVLVRDLTMVGALEFSASK
jgi:hypothetical protein